MSDQIVVSEGMLESLQGTRPWVKFLAILGFIVCALMALASLAFLGGASMMPGPMAGYGPVLGVVYLAIVALYFFPCLFLYRYAKAIARIPAEGGPALEDALARQKSFWKFIGILTAVLLVLEVLILVFSVFLGAMLGSGHR